MIWLFYYKYYEACSIQDYKSVMYFIKQD